MKITKIIDKFFETQIIGVSDTPALRTALTDTFANIKALTNVARVPVGIFRGYPPALTHKLFTAALKVSATLSATPTAAELTVARDILYAKSTEYSARTTTPLPVDVTKTTLRSEIDKLVTHARGFDILSVASPSLVTALGSNGTTKSAVIALFDAADQCNLVALRAACALVRVNRGMSEACAPAIKPSEVSVPADAEGDIG